MDWDHIELRLEEAVFNASQVRQLGIEVGDFIVHGYLLHALIAGYPPIQCRQQAASVAARLAE